MTTAGAQREVPRLGAVNKYPALSAAFSRRSFLKVGGALLSAPLLSTRARAQQPTARVAIVGAGIAGLTAALTLADQGISSVIFEASDRIGGRMHSNTTTWSYGMTSEWCGEFINSDHLTIRALAQRFGLPLQNVNAADPPDSVETNYFQGGYYLNVTALAELDPVFETIRQQEAQAGYPTTYNQYNAVGYALDHMSVYDWIEEYVPGGHQSRAGELVDVLVNTEYGVDTNQQSALNLVYFGYSNERFHIAGGNQQLPEAIAATLPEGSLLQGWRLAAIGVNSDQSIGMTFSTPDGTQEVSFDKVILTVPFSVLRGIDYSNAGFDPLKVQAIQTLGYGTNSKLELQFNDRYWNETGAWPGISNGFIETNLPFQSTWDSSRAQTGPTGLLVDYTGGAAGAAYHASQPYSTTSNNPQVAQFAAQFLSQLELVWPGISAQYSGIASLSYPTGDPNVLGSYSCWLTGQYTEIAGYEGVPQGNIYFAGEHTSINFQGYMEGGAQQGIRAANEVAQALGVG
jgi:monoamine oxidase